jgi:hypothetical protein
MTSGGQSGGCETCSRKCRWLAVSHHSRPHKSANNPPALIAEPREFQRNHFGRRPSGRSAEDPRFENLLIRHAPKKGSGTENRNGPRGALHFRYLPPFSCLAAARGTQHACESLCLRREVERQYSRGGMTQLPRLPAPVIPLLPPGSTSELPCRAARRRTWHRTSDISLWRLPYRWRRPVCSSAALLR